MAITNFKEVSEVVWKEVNGGRVSFEVQEGGFACKEDETRHIRLTAYNPSSFNGREEVTLSVITKYGKKEELTWEVSTASTGRDLHAMATFVYLCEMAARIQAALSK